MSGREIRPLLGTPEVEQSFATINSEIAPTLGENGDPNSPHHQRSRTPHYRESPLPIHSQLSHLSLSPNLNHGGASNDLLNNIRRQAMLNETNTARPSGHGLDVIQPIGLEGISNGIEAMGLGGPLVINLTRPPPFGFDSNNIPPMGVDLDNTFAHYKKPPEVEYTHNYSYELNDDLSRREDPGSPYNYPPDMTFAKRKFNTRTSDKHAKKRRKLEREFFENGGNERNLNETLDISEPSGSHVMDRTWMPEADERRSLDKTWAPFTAQDSSDSDRELESTEPRGRSLDKTWVPFTAQDSSDSDVELESTEPRGRSLDKTWVPEMSTTSDSEDKSKSCLYCTSSFSHNGEVVEHITAVHGDRRADAVAATKPQSCNCPGSSEAVAFCESCPDNPFLCDLCLTTHKTHGILYLAQSNSSQINEDPFEVLEKVLNSVCPDRAALYNRKEPSTDKSYAQFDEELITIRHESCKLAKLITKSSEWGGFFVSSTGSKSSVRSSRSSSLNSRSSILSLDTKPLTEEIVVDNLLPIFSVDRVEVRVKVAVVMEILLRIDAIHPSLFCDARSIAGFKSLLAVRDVNFLQKALSSLNQLIVSVGNEGIFFSLLKIKEELFGVLGSIQNPNTKLAASSDKDASEIKNMTSMILKMINVLID